MLMARNIPPFLVALALSGVTAWAGRASAHISLEQGGTHESRYGDSEIKDAPCGRADGERGSNVYTYAPGETITVSLVEYIPHPSYFRIAFDEDGDDDFRDPVSIQPIDPNRPCPFDEYDQCGTTDEFNDFYNTPAVLPEMDNLDPHVEAPLGEEYTWEVTLPNVQCDNCTLQVIQVMQDTIHGGYNTDSSIEPGYIEDVYHQCIDLVLEGPLQDAGASGGSGSPDGSAEPTSGTDAGGGSTASGPAGGAGCSCRLGEPAGTTSYGAALWGLAVGWIARRRLHPRRRP